MGRALIEDVRGRYSARVSVLQGASSGRSSTDRFLRSFAERWEDAAELFFQTLASLSRGAARAGEDPRVKGEPSAGGESLSSLSRRFPARERLGLEEPPASRRAARRTAAGALPSGARVSRDLQSPEESLALRRRDAAGEEGPAGGAREDGGPGSLPAAMPSGTAAFETAPQAPAEPGRARQRLEGDRDPETAEREESDARHDAPVPGARDRDEDRLPPRVRSPRREALEGADACATPPGALDASGIPDLAKVEPPEGGSDSPAFGDSRRRPRRSEGAARIAFPASLEDLDRQDVELERLEALLDERKRFEEALREWEGKGF